jgi:hypothetical protein
MPKKQVMHSLTLLLCAVSMTYEGCHRPVARVRDISSIVNELLGENNDITYNKPKTFALCQQERSGDHAARRFKYIVVRMADMEIVHEGSFRLGYVKWVTDDSIEVLDTGHTSSDEPVEKKVIKLDSLKLYE